MEILSNYLPAEEAKLRIHGNGFLQAETANGNKIHVWDERLPSQKVETFIHNHNHGFDSTIACGVIEMEEWGICLAQEKDTERFMQHKAVVRQDKDTILEPFGQPMALHSKREFWLQEGSSYTFPYNMELFHEVQPFFNEMTITLVTRIPESYTDNPPTVLVPVGVTPDNDFNRYAHFDIAKEVYEEAIALLQEKTIDI